MTSLGAGCDVTAGAGSGHLLSASDKRCAIAEARDMRCELGVHRRVRRLSVGWGGGGGTTGERVFCKGLLLLPDCQSHVRFVISM